MPPRRSTQSTKQQNVALRSDTTTDKNSPSQHTSSHNTKSTGTSPLQNAATTTALPQTSKAQVQGGSTVTTVTKSGSKTVRMATKMPSKVSHHSSTLEEESKGKKRAREAVEDGPKPGNTSSKNYSGRSEKKTMEDYTESDSDVDSNDQEQDYSEQPMKYLKRQTEGEPTGEITQHVSQERNNRDESLNEEESSEGVLEDLEVDDVEMEDEVDTGMSGIDFSSAHHSAASSTVHQSNNSQSPKVAMVEESRRAFDSQNKQNVVDDRHYSELRQRPSVSSASAVKLPPYGTQVYGINNQSSVSDRTAGKITYQTASSGSTKFENSRSNMTPDYGRKSFPPSRTGSQIFSVSSPKGWKELTLMQKIGRLLEFCLVLLVVVIIAAFIVLIYHEQLSPTKPTTGTQPLPATEKTETVITPPEETEKVTPSRQLKYFHVGMAKLRQQFPSQTDRFWLVLDAATEPIILQANPTHPAVIMLVAAGVANNSAADCLAEQYAQLVTKTFQTQQRHAVFGSHVGDNVMKPDQVKRELDNQFTRAFETGTKVGIVRHVEKLPGEAAMIFYRFCDNDNAPFTDVSIVLTLTLESNDPGNEKDTVAYKELRSTWKASLDVDKVEPLLSRIGNSVAFVRPESLQHLKDIGCSGNDF